MQIVRNFCPRQYIIQLYLAGNQTYVHVIPRSQFKAEHIQIVFHVHTIFLFAVRFGVDGWKDGKILVTCDKHYHTKLICRTRFTISVQDQGHRSRSAAYSDLFPKYLLSSFNDLHMANMLTG